MPWKLYDYVNSKGVNEFRQWSEGLDKRQLAKLNNKLDMLENNGPDLPPNLLSGTRKGNIKKLKIHGNPQLRPLLCQGPLKDENAYTLLLGAKEVGNELDVADAFEVADGKRKEVIADPSRRCEHERVKPSN